jgi:hypothetical protein
MATYKIHLDPESNELTEVTFEQLCVEKGIKKVGRSAAEERAARARLTPARSFGLINFVAQNDTAGYVKAWREQNHLTN